MPDSNGNITSDDPTLEIPTSWSVSESADTAAPRCGARSPRLISWRLRRQFATTGAVGGSTARSYLGKDTHGLSGPAQRTAREVLAANKVETFIQRDDGVTPTPVISHAILVYNRGRKEHFADGIVITPSHNPPEDGGFKYNPPNGGPADTDVTRWVQDRANELLRKSNAGVKREPFTTAIKAPSTHQEDYVGPIFQEHGISESLPLT